MQCPCGGETTYCTHEVKTLEKAQEWYSDVEKVPIIVCYDRCTACGRIEKRPWYKSTANQAKIGT